MTSPKPGNGHAHVGVAAQVPAKPDFDALAASFGGLSVTITIAAIVVGMLSTLVTVLSVIVTVAWNRSSAVKAVMAAREAASAEAMAFMRREGLPRMTEMAREHLEAQLSSGVSTATGLASASFSATGQSATL